MVLVIDKWSTSSLYTAAKIDGRMELGGTLVPSKSGGLSGAKTSAH